MKIRDRKRPENKALRHCTESSKLNEGQCCNYVPMKDKENSIVLSVTDKTAGWKELVLTSPNSPESPDIAKAPNSNGRSMH